VKRLLCFVLSLGLVITLTGCGNIFVRGALPGNVSTISGTVGTVQLTVVIGNDGATVQVTFVTFLQSGAASTVGFCGDRRDQFPLDQTVRAEFNPGQPCASIVTIVIT
jgi:hypothetical protein